MNNLFATEREKTQALRFSIFILDGTSLFCFLFLYVGVLIERRLGKFVRLINDGEAVSLRAGSFALA